MHRCPVLACRRTKGALHFLRSTCLTLSWHLEAHRKHNCTALHQPRVSPPQELLLSPQGCRLPVAPTWGTVHSGSASSSVDTSSLVGDGVEPAARPHEAVLVRVPARTSPARRCWDQPTVVGFGWGALVGSRVGFSASAKCLFPLVFTLYLNHGAMV